jgi:hypothetical protein
VLRRVRSVSDYIDAGDANSGADVSSRRWCCMRKSVLLYVDASINMAGMQVLT